MKGTSKGKSYPQNGGKNKKREPVCITCSRCLLNTLRESIPEQYHKSYINLGTVETITKPPNPSQQHRKTNITDIRIGSQDPGEDNTHQTTPELPQLTYTLFTLWISTLVVNAKAGREDSAQILGNAAILTLILVGTQRWVTDILRKTHPQYVRTVKIQLQIMTVCFMGQTLKTGLGTLLLSELQKWLLALTLLDFFSKWLGNTVVIFLHWENHLD